MSSLGQNRQAGDKGSFVLGSLAGTQNKGKHAGAGGKRHSTQSQVTISCLVPRPEPNFRHRTHKLKRWPGLKEEGPCKATSNMDVYSTSISPVLPRRKQWHDSFTYSIVTPQYFMTITFSKSLIFTIVLSNPLPQGEHPII